MVVIRFNRYILNSESQSVLKDLLKEASFMQHKIAYSRPLSLPPLHFLLPGTLKCPIDAWLTDLLTIKWWPYITCLLISAYTYCRGGELHRASYYELIILYGTQNRIFSRSSPPPHGVPHLPFTMLKRVAQWTAMSSTVLHNLRAPSQNKRLTERKSHSSLIHMYTPQPPHCVAHLPVTILT